MIALSLVAAALAAQDEPCTTFYTPTEVVESAMRVTGARAAGLDEEPEKRTLRIRLACASDALTEGDAAAVHLALTGQKPEPRPAPKAEDAKAGPPHPEGGVALVDGQAFAALRPGRPALVQAFDAEGRVVYTQFLDARAIDAIQAGGKLPDAPTLPDLPPVPLGRSEIVRLIVGGALVATGGALFAVAADARSDWYAYDPAPVSTPEELERLRIRANVTQGAAIASAGIGAAALVSVAIRVPF